MKKQLNLFEEEPKDEQEATESDDEFSCDKLMMDLELLNAMAGAQNDLLKRMIDDLQKDWTDDDKLQINDPKEYKRQQELKNADKTKEEAMSKELTAEATEAIKKATVTGNIVKLHEGQLDRKIYLEVKNRLELIGGSWKGGKIAGFVFQENPSELLEQIAAGGNRNLKKEFQFFATPDHLCDRLVELADFRESEEPLMILEPSAGQGAIVDAITKRLGGIDVYCYEAMTTNKTILERRPNVVLLGDDFLKHDDEKFDYIIANPPFAKNQDITHVTKMWECLAPGGRIVSITGKHWKISSNKRETAFREWLNNIGAEIHKVDSGEFKESGTTIATVILVIDKPSSPTLLK